MFRNRRLDIVNPNGRLWSRPGGVARLKIGLPKLRFSRKLLIITLSVTVLLGGSGVTALFLGGKTLLLESGESAIGGECTDIHTVVVKTPSDHLWLRKFIRMENASGPERIRTALRISGLLAKKHAVDLIHVSVLDAHGPTLRSQMRARSIGAEVLIALKPENLPEMKSPAMASYYEGPVSDEGRYYGDKVIVDIDEIGAMMTAMRTIGEKPDCVSPEPVTNADVKPNNHGKKEESEAKPADHGAKPAEEHGDKPAADHGEEPAKEGADEAAHAEQPAKEKSFLDGMLSMVGLGSDEEKPAQSHTPAVDDSHAVAEEPSDHADQADGGDPEPVVKTKDHAAEKADGHKAEKPSPNHETREETKAHPVTADQDADAKPAAHTETGDKAEAHDASAHVKEDATTPADAGSHVPPKKAEVDEHAEVNMPVGD